MRAPLAAAVDRPYIKEVGSVRLLAAAALLAVTFAVAGPAAADSGRPKKTEDTVAGGAHFRIAARPGAIHVWVPPGYDRATAGTVIYVHGYYVDVDQAWTQHHLARQFKASGQNALFIVPEAPSESGEQVHWPSLVELRKTVARANIRLPDGPTIAIGHSGAFRTLARWVDNRLLAQVVLLDAMYGGQPAWGDFIDDGKHARSHKLVLIGSSTAAASKAFVKKYPYAVVRDGLPDGYEHFTSREKKARLLLLKTKVDHHDLADGGDVLPLILRLTPLRKL